MSDINFLESIELGKIQIWVDKKVAAITPISFPGQDSGKTEGVDTLGIIAYMNISGRKTGNFETLQGFIFNIRDIADGAQVTSSALMSPFVNARDGDTVRRQGWMGATTSTSANKLTDTSANFSTGGVTTNDKAKNFITGNVSTITNVTDQELTLTDDIFQDANAGEPYGVTATINVKILSFDYRWELPGLSWVNYTLSIMQVR